MIKNMTSRLNEYLRDVGPVHKFPFIDAIRGYAILAVIFIHAGKMTQDLPEWFRMFTTQGARGSNSLPFIIKRIGLKWAFTLF